MNPLLMKRCELFVKNYQALRRNFKFDSTAILPVVSLLYTGEGKEINAGTIQDCKSVIKKNAGLFSTFRSTTYLMTAALLSLSDEPERLFANTQEAYRTLKETKFHSSDYLVIAALAIAKEAESQRFAEIVSRARDIYDLMKREHPFLTSSSDYAYAVMLALSGKDARIVMSEAENCFYRLKLSIHSSDAVQTLGHILALGEEPAIEKCSRVITLANELKQRKNKFSVSYGLACLAVLALITADVSKVTDDIVEVSEFLKMQKGFGAFSISKSQRLMLSAGLVSYDYVDALKNNLISMTLMNSITSILIAQQTAMICATSSATVVSASSN